MKKIFVCLLLTYVQHAPAQDSIFYQNAEWSPDGKRICTEAIRNLGSSFPSDGYIINLAEKRVEKSIAGAYFPTWSRDGKFIAFTSKNNSAHGADIWLMNTSTGDTIRVTNDTVRNSGVSFSPDGKKLCFSSEKEGSYNLYIMNVDGSDIERITFDSARYFNPVWSPKGDKIVYYRERGDRRDKVYVLDLKDKKETKVTNDTLHDTFPGWLPDGSTISYTVSDLFSKDHVPTQIAFINADGGNKRLVENTTRCFCSRVSPDGKRIAVLKGRWPKSDIYVMNIDGSNAECITCNLIK